MKTLFLDFWTIVIWLFDCLIIYLLFSLNLVVMLLTVLGWKISLILYRALLHRETVALEWLGNYSINLSAHIWIIWLVPVLAVLTGDERGCPARRRWGILSSFSPFPDIKLIKHWLINQNRSSTESGIINHWVNVLFLEPLW